MASKYHNLTGLLRDLEAVEQQLDDTTTLLWEKWCELIDSSLEDEPGLGDDVEPSGSPNDGADGTAQGSRQLELEVRPDGTPVAGMAAGVHGRTSSTRPQVVRDGSPVGGAQGLTDAAFQAELARRGMSASGARRLTK